MRQLFARGDGGIAARMLAGMDSFMLKQKAAQEGGEAVERYKLIEAAREKMKSAIANVGVWRAEANADAETKAQFALVGRTADGRGIYKSNFPPNTPKIVKQERIKELWQNVWSHNPIDLYIDRNGEKVKITAQFNPEYSQRSDLAKTMYGNKKGTSADKRVTLDLADDLYQIAEESHYTGSKDADRSKEYNPAHEGVKEYHYFANNIYVEENGQTKPYVMNIDVKQKEDGTYFYSFGLEKDKKEEAHPPVIRSRDAAIMAGDELLPDNSVAQTAPTVNAQSMQNGPQYFIQTERNVQGAQVQKGAQQTISDPDTSDAITAPEVNREVRMQAAHSSCRQTRFMIS